MTWTAEFRENGGYDCMTAAWSIERIDDNGEAHTVAVVDLSDYGQRNCQPATAEQLTESQNAARLIAAAPDLLDALQQIAASDGETSNFEMRGIAVAALARLTT